jgi:cysteine synthase
MTKSEVELILNLYVQIMNASEGGTTDEKKDEWWTDLGSKIELLSAVLKKESNKQRLLQRAQKCKRVMKDTASWLNQVANALSRAPNRNALLQQAREALEQGRRGDLEALKADIHEAIADELSEGGGV